MQKNITFKELSFCGFPNYILTTAGILYNAAQKEIKTDRKHRFFICGKRISLKSLYRLAYNKEFCFDKI